MKKNIASLYLVGMIAPILFTLATVLSALIQPDYNHTHQFISELGAEGAETQIPMNWLGFVPTGVLIVIFSWALLGRQATILGKIGAILIGFFGLIVTLSGIFPCDMGCPMFGSTFNNIHQTIAPIAFMSMCLGILFTGLSFRKDPQIEELWIYTVISSLTAIVFLVLLIQSLESRKYTGLVQRLFLGTVFLWMGTCGYVLFSKSKRLKNERL